MALKKNSDKLFFFIVLGIFSLASPALGASGQGDVGDWWGRVLINGTITPDATPVAAYINYSSTFSFNTTVGAATSAYYLAHVEGAAPNNVTFKVCGVNATISNTTWNGTQVDWSAGNHAEYNLTWNRSADSAACTYACGCFGGYCNSGVCSSSATTTTTTVSSGGGGGSGSGSDATTTTIATTTTTVTTTTTTTTIREQATVAQITPAAPATITPTQTGMAIEQISVEVKNTVSNVQITVTQTSAAPSAAASAPIAISSSAGSVYKYIEINKVNIQDADIAKTKIKFKVERSWVNAEGINSATIAMSKLVNNAWTKLQTTKLSEDSNYIYFESELSSLSVFAVTGEKAIVTTTTAQPTTTTVPATTTTLPTAKPISREWIALAVAIIAIVAAAIYLFERKKSIWPWQR